MDKYKHENCNNMPGGKGLTNGNQRATITTCRYAYAERMTSMEYKIYDIDPNLRDYRNDIELRMNNYNRKKCGSFCKLPHETYFVFMP